MSCIHYYRSLLVTSLVLLMLERFEMISFGMLSKKQLLLFIAIFLLRVLGRRWSIFIFSLFLLVQEFNTLAEVSRGISLSFDFDCL